MKWVGPFKLRDLLENCINYKHPWPPEHNGVYVISRRTWVGKPSKDSMPLYVGSTTGQSKRFCTRVGDLIADMLGFYGDYTGHHSGGESLHEFCRKNRINPLDLFLGWAEKCSCLRCAETIVFKRLSPKLNKKSPPICIEHKNK
jgi:hypothetical protein